MSSTSRDRVELSPDLPRDPSAYCPSDNFVYHYKYREDPPITETVIETCIREGDVHPSRDPDCYQFEAVVSHKGRAYRWWLVVTPDGPPHTIVTAYVPDAESHEAAARRVDP